MKASRGASFRSIRPHQVRVHCHATYESSRPNAFLVHGLADSSETWAAALSALSDYNVWLFDLPWSGQHGVDWPSRLRSEQWWDIALDLVGVRPDLLLAHSFGATVALGWALRTARATPLRLILLSPFYCARDQPVSWDDIDHFARGVAPRLRHALRVRFGLHPPKKAVLDSMVKKLEERVVPDAIVELFRVFLGSRDWLLNGPRLCCDIVCGDQEELLVRNSSAALAQMLSNANYHRVADCGHYIMHERPAMLNQIISTAVLEMGRETP